jgi:hypothetical protein
MSQVNLIASTIIKHLMLITSHLINELKVSRPPQIKSNLQQMKTISLISKQTLLNTAPLFLG